MQTSSLPPIEPPTRTTTNHYTILRLSPPLLAQHGSSSSSSPPLSTSSLKSAYHRALLLHHPDKLRSLAVSSSPSLNPASPSSSNPAAEAEAEAEAPIERPTPATQPKYSIDQITTAYRTLSDPAARRIYDESLRLALLAPHLPSRDGGDGVGRRGAYETQRHTHDGVESVDLEDLTFEEYQPRQEHQHQPPPPPRDANNGDFHSAGGEDEEEQEQENREEEEEEHKTRGIWYRACRCGMRKGCVVTEEDLERAESDGGHGEIYVGCAGCSLFIRVLFGVADGEEREEQE